ncbi:hypothetical protein GCM10009422_30230 [Brevundimonas kwangchunensis]|uniref:Uncharacterized protein n=1 Tax=Brevundimonas kwangchunensis TaxID=322163 RepID=A0ABN1H741_9CAUL
MAAAYIAASLGNGPAAGAAETKVFQSQREKRTERLLLPEGGLVRFRAPIESSETNTEASLSAFLSAVFCGLKVSIFSLQNG